MYKSNPRQQNHQALKAARSLAQQTARRCANNYWLRLSSSIQMASWSGNIGLMYEGIKQATGKPTKRSAPLKSKTGDVIKVRDKQMSRWVEHYLDIYSRENSVTQEVLGSIEDLPVLEELDSEPTPQELSKAIDALASGKAPGEDGIPPEVIKCGNYWSYFTKSCVCAGEKARCPKTCAMPRSLPCTKIRVIAATATTTEASPCSASLARCSQECSRHTPGPRRAHLPRIPVRLQKQEIHSGHDLLHSTASWEVQWAADSSLHRLHRPHPGIWPCEQARSVPATEKIGCLPHVMSRAT